jgi:hypothetical protein
VPSGGALSLTLFAASCVSLIVSVAPHFCFRGEELVDLQPDMIVTYATATTAAIQRQTQEQHGESTVGGRL